jgi:peptidoglycan/LPS O-acetylase OafA/YrhL
MITGSELLLPAVMRGLSGFFGGVICYLVYRRYLSRINVPVWLASLVEVVLILMVIAVVQSELEYRSVWATLVFFLAVLWFSLEGGLLSTALKRDSLQFLGRLSYSMYMTHAAVIYLFTSLFLVLQKLIGKQTMSMVDGVRFFDTGYGLWNNWLVALMLASVLLCSCWTYRVIEVRGQALGKQLRSKPSSCARAKVPA